MTCHDGARAFVRDLHGPLCGPAFSTDLASLQSLLVHAYVDNQDYSEYPGNEHYTQDQEYKQDA